MSQKDTDATDKNILKKVFQFFDNNRTVTFLVIIIIIAGAFYLGSRTSDKKQAATKQDSLSLSVSKESARVGDDVLVSVRVDAQTKSINTVQADVTYPTKLLEYSGFDDGGSAFSLAAQAKAESGTVSIIRANTAPRAGNQFVIKLKFKAISKGEAKLRLTKNSLMLSSSGNKNILDTTKGTSLKINY